MKAFYSKELPDQPLYLNGKAYRFDLMETEDQSLIRLLDSACARRIGGVTKLTEQQYLDKKKQKQSSLSSPKQYKREEIKQKVFQAGQRFVSRKPNANVAASARVANTPAEAALAVGAKQDISAFIPKPVSGIL